MTRPLIACNRRRGVDYVTLSSAHNKNALSIQLLEELLDVVDRNATDHRSRGLVIGHDGDVFCSGVDLVERKQLPAGAVTHSELLADLLTALWDLECPVLCHVHGAVRGGGLGLLSCADIVIAGTRSNFAYSEVRVGVAPALVGVIALSNGVPRALLPLLITGRRFDVADAVAAGLVTHAADDDGGAEVETVIGDLLRSGPNAVRLTKSLARDIAADAMPQRIADMTKLSAELFTTREAQEGMTAFAEKRAPVWPAPVS